MMDAECCNLMSPVCFLTGHDQTQILESVQQLQCMPGFSEDRDIIYLGRQNQSLGTLSVRTPSKLLVELYRLHCRKPGESGGKTILSAESQLVVVQLCLAEYSKQKYDIYGTDASEVLQMSRELADRRLSHQAAKSSVEGLSPLESVGKLYEAFLLRSNMVDMVEVYRQVKALTDRNGGAFLTSFRAEKRVVVLQLPENPLERQFLELLCGGASVTVVQSEILPVPLPDANDEGKCKLHIYERNWDTLNDVYESGQVATLSPKSPCLPTSVSEVLVRQLFQSFLGLLLNSRDEISLARCLSYSPSGLDHKGFTALKNLAKMKNMSMYQTAVSYITRLRLGGKRYNQSAESLPVAAHVKPLGEFVTNVQRLQLLVEEIPDARESMTKVLHTIKAILCKSRGSVLQPAVVEKVCGEMRSDFEALALSASRKNDASTPKTANQGGSIWGLKTLKLIWTFLDEKATSAASHNSMSALSDYTLTQTTPIRMPSLLDQFRSPEVENPESPENQELRDRVTVPKEMVKQPVFSGHKSDMAWAEPTCGNPLREQNPNVDRNRPGPSPAGQPFKLWAETPPEKHRRAKIFTHDFDSAITSPPRDTHRPLDTIDHTPKRPKGRVRNITTAALDKENLVTSCEAGVGGKVKGAETNIKQAEVKRRVKRVLMEDKGSSQPSKRAKKGATGGQKKKQVALAKGQKTLTHFFRL